MIKYIGIGSNELDTYLDYAVLSIVAIYMFNATPLQMGGLGACFALPFLFSSNLFGRLLDNAKIHHYRVMLFLINAITTPLFMLTGSIAGLYCIASIKTLSRCGLNISNVKLNTDDSESKRFFEIYGYLINISRIVIPIIGVYIYQHYGLWYAIGLSSLLNLVGLLASTEQNSRIISKSSENNSHDKYSFWLELKKQRDLLYLVVGYTLANLAFFMSNDMLGLFFRALGQSENSIGMIISLLGIGGFFGTKVAAVLNSHIKSVQILMVSMLFNITAFTLFGFVTPQSASVMLFYFAIMLIGASSGITFFAVRYGVRNMVGYTDVGKATGMVQMISSVVAILMPMVGGVIAGATSLIVTFRLTCLMLIATLVAFLIFFYNQQSRSKCHEEPTENE